MEFEWLLVIDIIRFYVVYLGVLFGDLEFY